jgi:hypothetical protein
MNDKFHMLVIGIMVIAVIGSIIAGVYIGSRNPRCLLSNDPFLCLEVHEQEAR